MLKGKLTVCIFMFAVVLGLFTGGLAFADTTIAYPDKDHAVFTVTAPDSWEMQPGEGEDDYFTLTGPNGAVLSFRAIAGTKEDLEGAIKDGVAYIKDNYNDVKMGDAVAIQGIDGFYVNGTGKSTEDGTPCIIHMKWFALKSGNIAEIWFEAAADDKAEVDEAVKILNTFKGM